MKKVSLASACNVGSGQGSAVQSATAKTGQAVSGHDSTTQKHNVPPVQVATVVRELNVAPNVPALCSSIASPQYSEDSVYIDGTVSTCDSMKSPDYEYSNNGDSMLTSLEGQANENLCILEDRDGHGLFSLPNAFL